MQGRAHGSTMVAYRSDLGESRLLAETKLKEKSWDRNCGVSPLANVELSGEGSTAPTQEGVQKGHARAISRKW